MHDSMTLCNDKTQLFFFCLVQLSVRFDLPLIKITTCRSLYTEIAGTGIMKLMNVALKNICGD